jgi:hypothetical protein
MQDLLLEERAAIDAQIAIMLSKRDAIDAKLELVRKL